MHENKRATTKTWLAGVLAVALAASGCGMSSSDVELNGGIFDLMGISGSGAGARTAEPKIAPRAGLVLPPSEDRLPRPGESGAAPASTAEAWPDDPDQRRIRSAAQLDRQQAEFCRKQALLERTGDTQILPDGPKGPCTTSILGLFGVSGQQ